MRLRHIRGSREFVAGHELTLEESTAQLIRGTWRENVFQVPKDATLCLEVGMGRGRFLVSAARMEPEVCYIGLEIRNEMIMEAVKRAGELPMNLRYLHANAGLLAEMFAPGEVDKVYVHFPDPWPKSRHAKRRLTAPAFLQMYHSILKDGGELFFKTDNAELFQWSKENFAESPFDVLEMDEDLPAEKAMIITEYESRYRTQGVPIHYLHAKK